MWPEDYIPNYFFLTKDNSYLLVSQVDLKAQDGLLGDVARSVAYAVFTGEG